MHARAAERFRIHHLSHRAFHQVGTSQSHEAGAFHHDDDVAQSAGRYAPPAMHGPITAAI